jgi:hypothetical protein
MAFGFDAEPVDAVKPTPTLVGGQKKGRKTRKSRKSRRKAGKSRRR